MALLMSKINLYALPCPVLRAGRKFFLSRAQGRTGRNKTGHRAGQGRKKCPVTVSGSNSKYIKDTTKIHRLIENFKLYQNL
jgi:hypothetical protein